VIRVAIVLALAVPFVLGAQGPAAQTEITDPVLRKLVQKGVLTSAEAREASDQAHLLRLLVRKGIFSVADAREIAPTMAIGPVPQEPVLVATISGRVPVPAVPAANAQALPDRAAPASPPAVSPPVVAAICPLRVLPVDPVKREGMIPDLKLGSGARLKPYGMIKASTIYDTSSPSGTDMPLPYMNVDAGPTVAPEFHVRARNLRLGTHFEWLDLSPKWAITGRFEADFEGNFSRSLNRNISTIRSSMFSIRTAWGRVDRTVTDRTSVFFKLGQDWTPFGSSTLPNLVETTGLGLGFGTLYERAPLALFGVRHAAGGRSSLVFQPEIAVSMPAYGNDPVDIGNQLGYGERQGADSGRPEVQGRLVTEWQLDKAPGVVPAQFIVSFVQGKRTALVPIGNVPAAFKSAFPSGAEVSSTRYGYTLELQAPTRAFTWQGKYFSGKDLRWYFVGGLYSNYNDTAGLTGVTAAPSGDGGSTVAFGFRNGVPVIAPERAVRDQGFMTDLSFPISRWFRANPSGHHAGWSTNLHYGFDMVPARDARRLPGVRSKNDLAAFTLNYKMTALISFQFEQSMYRTRAANNSACDQGGLFTLRGVPARQWHDIRSELGILFLF
jgi:hypothetical protein